jgi:hypothetical protein
MERKPKMPAARNPFVALAARRKAGVHRKSNKAARRSEKVKLLGGVAHRSSTRLLTGRTGFDSPRLHQESFISASARIAYERFTRFLFTWNPMCIVKHGFLNT